MLTVLTGDAIEQLRTLPNESVQCCVTSPPYWGLRDYGTAAWEGGDESCDHQVTIVETPMERNESGDAFRNSSRYRDHKADAYYERTCGKCGAKRIDSQLGLEKTPEEYVAKMVDVMREVRRVLRKDGTLWLNLGDSYASSGERSNNNGEGASTMGWPGQRQETLNKAAKMKLPRVDPGLKPKDLCGIPWRVAFALQADGWWLRSDIIWNKPNPMPESVTDRPTKSHEYLFLLTKSANYFYDAEAIKEKSLPESESRYNYAFTGGKNGMDQAMPLGYNIAPKGDREYSGNRNKRSVWTVATAPYPEAHFATYPPDLIKPCILAGTSAKGCCVRCGAPWERIVKASQEYQSALDRNKGKNHVLGPGYADNAIGSRGQARSGFTGSADYQTLGWQPTCKCSSTDLLGNKFCKAIQPCTVLDPFAGSGTTGMVALELGRKAVLIELNPKYCELIEQRCNVTPGLQLA